MERILEGLNYMNNSGSEFASAQDETSFILQSISNMNEKNISLENFPIYCIMKSKFKSVANFRKGGRRKNEAK